MSKKAAKETDATGLASEGVASEPQGETQSLVRVKMKKKAHVAGCIAAPGAVVNVTKESAERLVADGVAVILY